MGRKPNTKGGGKKKGGGDKLNLDDDEGHFGLARYIPPKDLLKRKWNKVDMGDLVPPGMDMDGYSDLVGIQELDPKDYPAFTQIGGKKRKADKKKDKKDKSKKQKRAPTDATSPSPSNNKTTTTADDESNNAENGDVETTGDNESSATTTTNDDVTTPTTTNKKQKNKDKNKPTKEQGASTSKAASGQKSNGKSKKENGNKEEEVLDESLDMSAWDEFNLHPKLAQGLRLMRFTKPTEIQARAIPAALIWRDVIAAAETGSGKTLAYGLPILHQILREKERHPDEKESREGPLAVIVSPTRELATQIVDHLKQVTKFTTINEMSIVPIIGGMSNQKQERLMTYKPDIIVCTPGRLWDLYENGNEYLENLGTARWVVLDEADRLIQGNHFKEMDMLFNKLQMKRAPATTRRQKKIDQKKNEREIADFGISGDDVDNTKRQVFLFSATLIDQNIQIQRTNNPGKKKEEPTSSVSKLFSTIRFQNKIETIDITKAELTATNLREAKIHCDDKDKDYYLYYLLLRYKGRSIVFVNSIHGVKRLASILKVLNIPAFPLFADMEQRMRLKNLERFKSVEGSVLVATDVAARGLDIPDIDHVIHFQIPLTTETYVHRSGRTARANKEGISVMLISPDDQKTFIKIFSALHKDVETVLDFPVDPFFMPNIRKRVDLAHKVELSDHRKKKAETEKQWVVKNLKLSEGDLKDYYSESDSDNDAVLTKQRKQRRDDLAVEDMREELAHLLQQPLLPTGITRSYVTSSHFDTKLLVDPASFHAKPAIKVIDEKGKEKGKDNATKKKKAPPSSSSNKKKQHTPPSSDTE